MSIYQVIDDGPLLELQLQAEGGMVNSCRIDRVIGITTDNDGRDHPLLADPIYIGPCKLRSYRPYEEQRDVAGSTVTSERLDLHIPAVPRMDALVAAETVTAWGGPVRNGDYATITMDGLTRVMRIGAPHHITRQTAQRLLVDEILGGIPAVTP